MILSTRNLKKIILMITDNTIVSICIVLFIVFILGLPFFMYWFDIRSCYGTDDLDKFDDEHKLIKR